MKERNSVPKSKKIARTKTRKQSGSTPGSKETMASQPKSAKTAESNGRSTTEKAPSLSSSKNTTKKQEREKKNTPVVFGGISLPEDHPFQEEPKKRQMALLIQIKGIQDWANFLIKHDKESAAEPPMRIANALLDGTYWDNKKRFPAVEEDDGD